MELIIQKCIEIGVDSIVPVKTEHTVVKLDGKEDKKVARWNKIAEAAAKQCGRGKIPVVESVMSFGEAIEDSKKLDRVIIPYEKETKNNLKSFTNDFNGETIGIFIGPEGGFAQSEVEKAVESGATSITLGKRILRTETAGLVASVILLHELEN
jgi:16S rRNA (uracil1498-N3)-methyltransferase